jgi:hypothetical protein
MKYPKAINKHPNTENIFLTMKLPGATEDLTMIIPSTLKKITIKNASFLKSSSFSSLYRLGSIELKFDIIRNVNSPVTNIIKGPKKIEDFDPKPSGFPFKSK